MKKLLFIILFLNSFNGVTQQFADKEYYLIDSLVLEDLTEGDRKLIENSIKKYHSAKHDTSKIQAIEFLIEECWDDNVWPKYNSWVYEFVNQKLKITNGKTLKKSLADALNNIGYLYSSQGQLKEALDYYGRGLKIREEIDDKKGISNSLNNIGYLYETQGQVKEALDYYGRGLKIQEVIDDKKGASNSLNNIAEIYRNQDQLNEALKYHIHSLKIREEIGYKYGIANSHNNIGLIYKKQGQFEEALEYHNKSLQIREEIGDKKGIANSLNNIGAIYTIKGQFKEALNYDIKSLKVSEEIGDKEGIGLSLNNIGYLHKNQGHFKEALEYGNRSLKISKEIGIPWSIKYAAKLLSGIYEKQGNGMKALEMYKLYIQMKDSINNEATQKASIRQQTKYEFEKAQIVKENEAKEQSRLEAEATGRRNNLQYSLMFLGILVLFVGILFLGFIKVSPSLAEGLIFFAFLILFEFVLVFTETYLEHYTQGEPMYNLFANSILALLIFPLHSVLERLLKKRILK